MKILRKIFLENNLINNAHIKIISFIIGYSLWAIFSESHVANIVLDAPVCFYNVPSTIQINCKDKVKVELSAKRSNLYTIDRNTLAFHIDMHDAKVGDTVMKLCEEQLLLPDSIKMARCYPANVAVSVK